MGELNRMGLAEARDALRAGEVTSVDVSADGKIVCSVSQDRTIRLFATSHLAEPQQK